MAIVTNINWPAVLHGPLREGRSTQHGKTFLRTDLASGRARQRRSFTSVPSMRQMSWLFTQGEAMAFEAWFRDVLKDGAEWFNVPGRTPLGNAPMVCRFADMYSGPDIDGRNRWRVSAPLEAWERPLLPVGWGNFPDLVAGAEIIDYAVNQEWPKAP